MNEGRLDFVWFVSFDYCRWLWLNMRLDMRQRCTFSPVENTDPFRGKPAVLMRAQKTRTLPCGPKLLYAHAVVRAGPGGPFCCSGGVLFCLFLFCRAGWCVESKSSVTHGLS